ncbi:uncharacterized protein ColSpa_02657 [Colletotrichum spaethianum]|uniref:Uncharacterized protein n=1 Tax=Colletotrichum spaethianum TaxID=700344 RepID=A0AA37L5N1_9PEZI|nr:uncharacterized protein ColSpa_02657 [Colletotrichum spaethianum]GKT42476.1 hypothetical protein ColSpa_02657 [Colletotrichum spaethianum]
MIPAQLQHVTRIFRQLPLRSSFLPPLARYSSSKRRAAEQTAAPSAKLPDVPELNKSKSLDDLEKAQLSQHWMKIFDELDIGTPANNYRVIRLPNDLKAVPLTRFRMSKRHIMRAFDTFYFTEHKHEHPKAVLMRHYYEEDKKNKPLWIWFYGIFAVDTPAVVSMAKYRMKLALHAALKHRGYDAQGRIIDSESETGIGTTLRGNLQGTIACVAKFPRDVVKRLPKKDLRLAMDAVVDAFIRMRETTQMREEENDQNTLEKEQSLLETAPIEGERMERKRRIERKRIKETKRHLPGSGLL